MRYKLLLYLFLIIHLILPAFGAELNENTVFTDACYKIIAQKGFTLENVLADGMTDVTGSENTVVFLNDAPVVLSEVTDRGYIIYFALSEGEYCIKDNTKTYTDTLTHWALKEINYVSARNLFAGTAPEIFSPDEHITRGMFITVLGRMHGVDVPHSSTLTVYSDVSPQEYYAPYVKWAYDNDIFIPSGKFFNPDLPITRGEMALVISNYIKFCAYTFDRFEYETPFEDLDRCNDKIKNAIQDIRSLSIINGTTPSTFSPNDTLTRAQGAAVMTRLIKSILGVNYTSQYDNTHFSANKIRIGAFANINAESLNENSLNAYKNAGFNTILISNEIAKSNKLNYALNYCDKKGINAIIPQDLDRDFLKSSLSYYSHPSFYASFLADEIGSLQFEDINNRIEYYNSVMEDKKPLVNLLPLYSSPVQLKYGTWSENPEYYPADYNLYRQYCVDFCENSDSPVFMTSIMPYTYDGIYEEYIQAVSIASQVSSKYNREFWCMIQSDLSVTEENQFLRQYYTLLSFGCKNIILWPWCEGLSDALGNLTPTYYAVQSANNEINMISDVFVRYNNVGTALYNSPVEYDTEFFKNLKTSSDEIRELSSNQPILVGIFKNGGDEGNAFTFVNISENESAQVNIKLNCETLTLYFDGIPEQLPKNPDGYFSFELQAGQGVFATK